MWADAVQQVLLIKLYVWEMFFACKIGMLHKAEVHHIWRSACVPVFPHPHIDH